MEHGKPDLCVQQPVCWGPAHLASLCIAAGVLFLISDRELPLLLLCLAGLLDSLQGSRKVPECHCK